MAVATVPIVVTILAVMAVPLIVIGLRRLSVELLCLRGTHLLHRRREFRCGGMRSVSG
jgi:hypothetical protein